MQQAINRRWLFALSLLSLTVALMIAFFWPWIGAQGRAAIVLASVLELPGVALVTSEPQLKERHIAGRSTLVATPAGDAPHPSILFVNGTTPEGHRQRDVRALAEGLARAGYLVFVPDLPGMRQDRISPETASATPDFARTVTEDPRVCGGEVGLVGVSTGASLALLTAGEPGLREDISVVAGIAPYADIRNVMSLATTGHYRGEEGFVDYEPDPFLSYVAARSLISTLPEDGERRRLLAELDEVDRLSPRPLKGLREIPLQQFSPQAQSTLRLLENRDPQRFDHLYASLPPQTRQDLERLSPLHSAGSIEAPVELASAPRDKYFPPFEARSVTRIAPEYTLTVSGVLQHAEVEASPAELYGILELNGFVVRSLYHTKEARRGC